ncbi:plasmid pRiA4b ORF-3 family protein [Bacillota bacterium Lsc_1132]
MVLKRKSIKECTEQLSFENFWNDSAKEQNQPVEQEIVKKVDGLKLDKARTEKYPSSLVYNFNQFMDYIVNHPVQLTKKMQYISRKHLRQINERMTVKAENTTSYSEQEMYPLIHFFHFLGLSGRLLEKVPGKAGQLQLKVTDRYKLFIELTDTEKYFFLLETFWVDVNWDMLMGDDSHRLSIGFSEVFSELSQEKSGYRLLIWDNGKIARTNIAYWLYNWNYFLLYFEWLGFWVCEKNQEHIKEYGRKSSYFANAITLTTFGAEMIPILLVSRNLNSWNIPMRRINNREVNPIPGSKLEHIEFLNLPRGIKNKIMNNVTKDQSSEPFLQPFAELFPKAELVHTLPRSNMEFTKGIFTFKISFARGIWRKVVLSSTHTMDDLHEVILEAFQFDNDHLYSFFMDGRKWSQDCIASPYDDYGHPDASRVQIGSIGLQPQQKFLYLYDYGDEWTFIVEVDHIDEKDFEPFASYVAEEKGEAPEQYSW